MPCFVRLEIRGFRIGYFLISTSLFYSKLNAATVNILFHERGYHSLGLVHYVATEISLVHESTRAACVCECSDNNLS
jgi:hypothetical protein